jgi:hypothetical protein
MENLLSRPERDSAIDRSRPAFRHSRDGTEKPEKAMGNNGNDRSRRHPAKIVTNYHSGGKPTDIRTLLRPKKPKKAKKPLRIRRLRK